MFLPCCHIFAVRRHFGLDKYDDDLCSQRWAAKLYAQSATMLLNDDDAKESEALHIEQQRNHRILSRHQKYRKASSVTAKLASIVSEGSMDDEFSRKMELLEDLLCHWKNGIDVKFERSEESSDGASTKCARESSTDDCSVNLLENNDEAASDEDADDIGPVVTTSPAKIGTAVNVQAADLQDELADVHRKGSGQPLLAQGIIEEDGTILSVLCYSAAVFGKLADPGGPRKLHHEVADSFKVFLSFSNVVAVVDTDNDTMFNCWTTQRTKIDHDARTATYVARFPTVRRTLAFHVKAERNSPRFTYTLDDDPNPKEGVFYYTDYKNCVIEDLEYHGHPDVEDVALPRRNERDFPVEGTRTPYDN
ncbi:hypothetical protein MTO96_038604 [Rhipicephalus appendiculatus]